MEQFKDTAATVRQDCLDAGARLSLIKKQLSLSLARAFYLFLPQGLKPSPSRNRAERRQLGLFSFEGGMGFC